MIETFKSAYDHARENALHFNNAGFAPWSASTLKAVTEWALKLSSAQPQNVSLAFDETERVRGKLARFVGTKPEQIAFFQTCAAAISQVALGFPFKAGDEIVVWDQEYPSNFHPWRVAAERSGAKVVVAKSDANLATPFESLKSAVTAKTKVIAVSWVQFRSGAQTDLEKLAALGKANGIFTCVDVIQGVGAIPFNFETSGLDAVCGGAHKWLASPLSLGFLALKKEHLELLKPIMVGAMSYGGPDVPSGLDVPLKTGIQKFEPGGRSLLELVAFGATLDLFEQTGISEIAKEAERLSNKLVSGLRDLNYVVHSPHGERIKGAILNFTPSDKSHLKTMAEIEAALLAKKVSFSKRPPGIRLSPHAFVLDSEVETILKALSKS